MSSIFEIDERLKQWAYYRINLQGGNIGWPDKNLITGLKEGRGARFPTTGVCLIAMFDHSQQIDCWIRTMGREYPHLEEALTAYYTCKLPVAKLANLLGISRRLLSQRVYEAKLYLCGRLNAYTDAQIKQKGIL